MQPFLFRKRASEVNRETIDQFRELAERDLNEIFGGACCCVEVIMNEDTQLDHA